VTIDNIVGQQVRGYKCAIIYDDEIATGGSVLELCRILLDQGIEEIVVTCTHGVFSHGSLDRLTAIPQITNIVTTDTVPIPPEKFHPKLHILTVASIFGDAIRCNYMRQSIGDLFVYGDESP
jgi:ribose-phosphate pyrophosphokinase